MVPKREYYPSSESNRPIQFALDWIKVDNFIRLSRGGRVWRVGNPLGDASPKVF